MAGVWGGKAEGDAVGGYKWGELRVCGCACLCGVVSDGSQAGDQGDPCTGLPLLPIPGLRCEDLSYRVISPVESRRSSSRRTLTAAVLKMPPPPVPCFFPWRTALGVDAFCRWLPWSHQTEQPCQTRPGGGNYSLGNRLFSWLA